MIRTRMRIVEGVARGLCGSCRNSQIRTHDNGESLVECGQFYEHVHKVTRPVKECSEYLAKNAATEREMRETAWIIEVKKGKNIGFISPLEAQKKGLHRRDLLDF